MIAYTIAPALESGVFESVIVSTDSEEIAAIARHYGAEVPFLRPAAFAGDTSPDIEWLEHTLAELGGRGGRGTASACCVRPARFARPTRFAARGRFHRHRRASTSLRAVEKCAQHPGKMWVVRGQRMFPLLPFGAERRRSRGTARRIRRCRRSTCRTRRSRSPGRAWCSSGARLPATCWCRSSPKGLRGVRHQRPHDWMVAERLIADGPVTAVACWPTSQKTRVRQDESEQRHG